MTTSRTSDTMTPDATTMTPAPAAVGGRIPLRVPYGQTVHGEEEIAAVVHVLRTSTQMSTHVRGMEERVAALFAKKHGIMVNSGSSALYLAVELLGLAPGAEVVTPALTFATTVAPLVKAGLVPSFVDVEPDTFNIDVDRIEAAITDRTKALMIPSLIGNLPDYERISAIARARNLVLIEDSADTLGGTLRGKSSGTWSDISTTSFYGSHVINAGGNGGMLCVNRDDWNEEARLLRSWGRSSSLFQESEAIENRFAVDVGGIPYDAKFVFSRIGYNLEPSEMGAAFGLVQLDRLASNIEVRERNFAAQAAFFRDWEHWFMLPRQTPETTTGWLAFPLIIRDDAPFTRRDLQIHFEKAGIQTRTVFTGNILRQPAFASIRHRAAPEGYPNADRVMRGGMLLACHHGLTSDQLAYVHEQFRAFAAQHAR
jgi:CDP-6-deoxy-D-xylo-4-hexulose-3-dehydrase